MNARAELFEFLIAIINAHGSMISTDEALDAIAKELDRYAVTKR